MMKCVYGPQNTLDFAKKGVVTKELILKSQSDWQMFYASPEYWTYFFIMKYTDELLNWFKDFDPLMILDIGVDESLKYLMNPQ